jgi:hypothetical protein
LDRQQRALEKIGKIGQIAELRNLIRGFARFGFFPAIFLWRRCIARLIANAMGMQWPKTGSAGRSIANAMKMQ